MSHEMFIYFLGHMDNLPRGGVCLSPLWAKGESDDRDGFGRAITALGTARFKYRHRYHEVVMFSENQT